jgi:hypothetical protein
VRVIAPEKEVMIGGAGQNSMEGSGFGGGGKLGKLDDGTKGSSVGRGFASR